VSQRSLRRKWVEPGPITEMEVLLSLVVCRIESDPFCSLVLGLAGEGLNITVFVTCCMMLLGCVV
jgi:hypothetical protein